jgi:hypothetical protein
MTQIQKYLRFGHSKLDFGYYLEFGAWVLVLHFRGPKIAVPTRT